MGRLKVSGCKDMIFALERLGEKKTGALKGAVFEGASVVADAIREELKTLPTEHHQKLGKGKRFHVVSPTMLKSLSEHLGVATIRDEAGRVVTAVGFTGYGPEETATTRYPRGTPNAMIARSIERGTSVREGQPFFKTAVRKCRKEAEHAMGVYVKAYIKTVFKDPNGNTILTATSRKITPGRGLD